MSLKLNGNNFEDKFERIACPFCDSFDAEPFREIADIVKCRNCDLVYLRTCPDKDVLKEINQQYTNENSYKNPPENKEEIKKSIFKRNSFLEELLELTKSKGKLIEISCGWGAFIDNCRNSGFNVSGIENNKSLLDYAVHKLDLNVSNIDFLEVDLPKDSFSTVVMLHSLGNFPNPKEIIKKVYDILEPGGCLCGIVPNIDSFASNMLEDEWDWIAPYNQVTYFSPNTLTEFLEDAGFVIEKKYTTKGEFDKDLLIHIVRETLEIEDKADIESEINKLSAEGKGEEIHFFARKVVNETMTIEKNNFDIIEDIDIIESENSLIDSDIEKIEIELQPGDDFEKILFNIFETKSNPVNITLIDEHNILPDYSENWNGIKVKRKMNPLKTNKIINKVEKKVDVKNNILPESIVKNEKENILIEPKDIPMETNHETNKDYRLNKFWSEGFSNKVACGTMPETLPKPLFLNLGCGLDIRENFINLDLFSDEPSVVLMDIRKIELPDNSADLILASDILEHFSHHETDNLLTEWVRVLKPGGSLIIRCPSLSLQVKSYIDGLWDADTAAYMIFGGQTNPGDFHCTAFDKDSITKHLQTAGLEIIDYKEDTINKENNKINLNMTVRAIKKGNINSEKEKLFGTEGFNPKQDVEESDTINAKESNIQTSVPLDSNTQFAGMNFDVDAGQENIILENDNLDLGNAQQIVEEGNPQLNIVWEGSQFVYHSLAKINRELCSNIIDTEIADLTIIPYEPDEFEPEDNEKYQKLLKQDIRVKPSSNDETGGLPYVWIRHQWPPKDEDPKGAKWIIMQPWELSQLWEDMVITFKKADEIWTPSTFSRQCIVDSGIDFNKVQVIPNGIAPEVFSPSGNKYKFSTEKKLKFLFVGGTIYRKGIDILLESYSRAFTSDDDVCLVIKDLGGDSFYKGQTAKELIENIKKVDNAPEIIYIDEKIKEEEIAGLYRACDIYITPYRAEGFSLPTLEAMACGLPVIVTKGGSTDDFVDEEVGWQIPAEKKSVGNVVDGIKLSGEAWMLEPDIQTLSTTIKAIYSNPSEIFSAGVIASLRARTKWTWKKSTIKLFARLDTLYGKNFAQQADKKLVDFDDSSITLGEAEKEYVSKNYSAAAELFQKAIDLGNLPERWIIHALHRLITIEMLNENINKSEIESKFREVENYDKSHIDSKYLKIKLHILKKEYVESLEELTVIMNSWSRLKYETTQGITLDNLLCDTAYCLLEMGDIESALQVYTEALKYNNNNAYACYGSARCFIQIDSKEDAKKMLEWTLKINPELKEAEEQLNSLMQA